eukprot:352836-Chlamydomonas_euryale.AAC.15
MEFTCSSPTYSQRGPGAEPGEVTYTTVQTVYTGNVVYKEPAVLCQQEPLARSTMHCQTNSQSIKKPHVGPPPRREVERNGAQRSVAKKIKQG